MPGHDNSYERRNYDRHIERLEDRLAILSKLEARLSTVENRMQRLEDDVEGLKEAKYNIMMVVKEMADLKESFETTSAAHDKRLAALERIAYAILGMYVLLQAVPALQGIVGAP